MTGSRPPNLLQRSGRGADIFERGLRHDAALILAPVIAEFGQRAVDAGVVAGGGETKPGVAARIDFSEAMNQRDGPGPRALVHRGIEAELGEIERCRLQRQRHVDRGVALVDRKPDIDAGRDARADPGDAAIGPAAIADEIAERAGPGRNSVGLSPGPESRRLACFPRRRHRPDCSARPCRNRRSPDCQAAPGNCCRGWSRLCRPTHWN